MIDLVVQEELKKTYNAIKGFEEEKKSISEDIKEEKLGCSKKTGLDMKDINTIFRLVKIREKGINVDKYREYLDLLEGNSYVEGETGD